MVSRPLNEKRSTVEDEEICVGALDEVGEQGGAREWLLLEGSLEDYVIHGAFEFVLEDGHALVQGEVVLCIDELAVYAFVGLIDEMDTEIVCVSTRLEGTVERTIVLTHCIVVDCTVGGEVGHGLGLYGLLLH